MEKQEKTPKLACFIFLIVASLLFVSAQSETNLTCSVYITGIGCPNCAYTDPALLENYTSQNPELIVIEYEIYKSGVENQEIATNYFNSYIPTTQPGVPLIIFNKETLGLGRYNVLDSNQTISSLKSNACPMPDGTEKTFEQLDLTKLSGKIKIWKQNKVLISGEEGNNEILKKLLLDENISKTLEDIEYEIIEPYPVEISEGQIEFNNAIKINDWTFQWNDENNSLEKTNPKGKEDNQNKNMLFWLIPLFVLVSGVLFYIKKGGKIKLTENQKNYIIIAISVIFLLSFFIFAKNIEPNKLENLGYTLPLPIFTFLIAIVDGFNPCNIFVLTLLFGILISASHSRKKIYAIGYTFIFVVFLIYFVFMSAWLNIFKYIGFVTPFRIAIALIAIIAGLINCKELIAFRKGITLMIQDKHKKPLVKKIEKMKELIKKGSIPTLILASIGLAAFSSLVELPCTAGFPIIYTGILTGKGLETTFSYYAYLLFYNLIYVLPLIVIITIFGFTLKGKQITKRQMQIIKFIGGLIMLLLGLILLINPALIGIGFA